MRALRSERGSARHVVLAALLILTSILGTGLVILGTQANNRQAARLAAVDRELAEPQSSAEPEPASQRRWIWPINHSRIGAHLMRSGEMSQRRSRTPEVEAAVGAANPRTQIRRESSCLQSRGSRAAVNTSPRRKRRKSVRRQVKPSSKGRAEGEGWDGSRLRRGQRHPFAAEKAFPWQRAIRAGLLEAKFGF